MAMRGWREIGTPADQSMAQRIKGQLVHCTGWEGDELDKMRRDAYNYYFQRKRGDELPGRSQIVTNDLSAMVEGNLALMVEPLLSKRVVEFCAYDSADEEQAKLESDCVQTMIFKRQAGFLEITKAVKDCMLVRNAFTKVWVDTRTFTQQIRRNNVAEIAVQRLLQTFAKGGSTVAVHKYDPKTKQLSATVKKVVRRFRVESVAPENMRIPKDWHRNDFDGLPFCSERHVEPRSTLIERGFPADKVDSLGRYNNQSQLSSDTRLPRNMSAYSRPFDRSQDQIEWYESYVRVDDGTGASELRRISTSGNVLLEDAPSSAVSYAMGVCILNPHTFMGISTFDKVKWIQDSTTALTRGLMDNLNASNKNRTAHLDGVVNQEDLDDGRINGSVRVNPNYVQDVRAAITAFGVTDTSANILANLTHFKGARSESGGAALDLATGQMQLNDRIGSQGVDRAYSVMESLAKFMMLVISHTLIRQMFLVAHEVLRTQWQEPISFKRGNKWVKVNPSDWQVREGVEVNIGKSQNERGRIALVLDKLMEKQASLAGLGMEDVLVNLDTYHAAMMEWLHVNDIENPDRFVLDPRSDTALQALQENKRMRAESAKKQDELLKQTVALEQLRVAMEKYRTDVETQFKYYNSVLNAQIEEAKITATAVVDLQKARFAARSASSDTTGKKGRGKKVAGQSAVAGDSAEE